MINLKNDICITTK